MKSQKNEAYYKGLKTTLTEVVNLFFLPGVNTLRLEDLELIKSTLTTNPISKRKHCSSEIKVLDLWHVYPPWSNLDPLGQLLCWPKKLEVLRFGNSGDIDQIGFLSVLKTVKDTLERLDIEYMVGLGPVDADTAGFKSFEELTFLRVDHKFMEQILGDGKGIEDVLPTQLEEVSITFNDSPGFLLHGWTTKDIGSLLGPSWDRHFPSNDQYLEKDTFGWLIKLLDYKQLHKTALQRVQITDRRNWDFKPNWLVPGFLEERLTKAGVELEVIVTNDWGSRDNALYTVVTLDKGARDNGQQAALLTDGFEPGIESTAQEALKETSIAKKGPRKALKKNSNGAQKRAFASISNDDEYLTKGFDFNTLTVPKLRGILVNHDITYPASAKKPELLEICENMLRPKARKILAARKNAKRSTRGITDA